MPIDVGQAEVEQNHVRLALDSDPQPLEPIGRTGHRVTLVRE